MAFETLASYSGSLLQTAASYSRPVLHSAFRDRSSFWFCMAAETWLGRKIACALQNNAAEEHGVKRFLKVIMLQNGLIALHITINHLYFHGAIDRNHSVMRQLTAVLLETALFSAFLDTARYQSASFMSTYVPTFLIYMVCPADYKHA